MAITATTTTPTLAAATGTSAAVNGTTIASNFQSFLQLLTTQLKNQNPLDPLDTNQFTQQLVQFSQVEQQMKSNDQLTSLVSLQKSAQQSTALNYVGSTVVVDGSSSKLASGQASWNLSSAKPATATVTIKDANNQTAYSGSFAVNAGSQTFTWDGVGNDGKLRSDGNYTLSVTAKDASAQAVAVTSEIQAPVDSVDLTKTPPTLSVGGSDFALTQIKRIISAGR